VQLHIVEELLAMFSPEELTGSDSNDSPTTEAETVCSISVHALTGSSVNVPEVIQLQAFIEDKEILILVDSGSSTSFVNTQLASKLQGASPLPQLRKVNVADGTQHSCSSYIPHCPWSVGKHQFYTDLKILPLGSFDAILGMDWLEEHNPDIDWVKRHSIFTNPKVQSNFRGTSRM
jgi:hypothetical protein